MNGVQKRTLREINRRVEGPREINGSEMRSVFLDICGQHFREWQDMWLTALGKDRRGRTGLSAMSIDELEAFNYACTWCRRWNRSMETYLDLFGVQGVTSNISLIDSPLP